MNSVFGFTVEDAILPMWDIHGFSTEDARIDIENDILYLNHELEQLMDANN